MLIGGAGADVFVFEDGDGHDTLFGFVKGEDLIEMMGLTFADIALSLRGKGIQVSYGGDNTINVAKLGGQILDADDFLFV